MVKLWCASLRRSAQPTRCTTQADLTAPAVPLEHGDRVDALVLRASHARPSSRLRRSLRSRGVGRLARLVDSLAFSAACAPPAAVAAICRAADAAPRPVVPASTAVRLMLGPRNERFAAVAAVFAPDLSLRRGRCFALGAEPLTTHTLYMHEPALSRAAGQAVCRLRPVARPADPAFSFGQGCCPSQLSAPRAAVALPFLESRRLKRSGALRAILLGLLHRGALERHPPRLHGWPGSSGSPLTSHPRSVPLFSCSCFAPSWQGLQSDCQFARSQNSVLSPRWGLMWSTTSAAVVRPI
jgi:hypothetical protein